MHAHVLHAIHAVVTVSLVRTATRRVSLIEYGYRAEYFNYFVYLNLFALAVVAVRKS